MKEKKFFIFILLMAFIFGLAIYRIIDLSVIKKDTYQSLLEEKTNYLIEGPSAPRGRILDCHGKILVDNIGVKTIVYQKVAGISYEDEVEIAYTLANLIDVESKPSEYELKKFWNILHEKEAEAKITEAEKKLYKERKLTQTEIYDLKLSRITKEELNTLNLEDKVAAKIYSLMGEGYSYSFKVIKDKGVTEKEYANVIERAIPGVIGMMSWERFYPYGDTLRLTLGSVSSRTMGLPKEGVSWYLENGYSLTDRVGLSALEYQYESYLKGEKAKYHIKDDLSLEEVSSGIRGNDLYLSIDIDLQMEVEKIVKEEILKGKELSNTEYFDHAFVLIGDPKDGSIRAMVGQKLIGYPQHSRFQDISLQAISSSYTVGSVVKGASISVGYANGLIEPNKTVLDGCIKLENVPEKCSVRRLGTIDDIKALKYSSNYYQFLLAIKLVGKTYKYNMHLGADEHFFDIYRNMFASYGLGEKTGIDLPNEEVGIKGNTIADDLLLNFTIGQYDTYTPVMLLQYMNTIAQSGKRLSLHLAKNIKDFQGKEIWSYAKRVLNEVSLEKEYFLRIQQGLYEVTHGGTGSGYIDASHHAAGKTGTAESFLDTDGDGMIDVKTISLAFVMYAPVEDPKVSMVVMTPHVSHDNGKSEYVAFLSRKITSKVSKILFEKYDVS